MLYHYLRTFSLLGICPPLLLSLGKTQPICVPKLRKLKVKMHCPMLPLGRTSGKRRLACILYIISQGQAKRLQPPPKSRDGILVLCKKTRPQVQISLKGLTEGLTSVGGRGFWSQGTKDQPWLVGTEDRVTYFSHTCPMHSVYAKLAQE